MSGQIICVGAAAGILVLVLVWCVWRIFKPTASRLDSPIAFFTLIFLAILMLRLPEIRWAREINVDESQMLVQGMRYLSHPIPWRDVDGTTGGPLDSLLLSVPLLAGAPKSWVTPRVMLWILQCTTMIFIYRILRHFTTRVEAQAALLPTVFFYAFSSDANFTHYSSETLSVLLLSIMVWLLVRQWSAGKYSDGSLLLFGVLGGCVPFAKLQAAPMAACLLLAGVSQIIFRQRQEGSMTGVAWRKAGLICLGAVILPALLAGIVVLSGAGYDFWKSYILTAIAYTNDDLSAKLETLWVMFSVSSDFRCYFLSALAAGVLLLLTSSSVSKPKPGRNLLELLILSLILGITAIGCMLAAGKGYTHYLTLLIPAQAIFFGLVFATGKTLLIADGKAESSKPQRLPVWFLTVFALIISIEVVKAPGYFKLMRDFLVRQPTERKSYVARRVLKISRPGETMSVWGWVPSYYVETGMIPATRDAIGHFVIYDGPYRDYYQQRYLKDLRQNMATVFVDAMADGLYSWPWSPTQRHESFPELTKFIDDNYSLWMSIHILTGTDENTPVRVYLLKQRMKELQLTRQEITIPQDPSLAPE